MLRRDFELVVASLKGCTIVDVRASTPAKALAEYALSHNAYPNAQGKTARGNLYAILNSGERVTVREKGRG